MEKVRIYGNSFLRKLVRRSFMYNVYPRDFHIKNSVFCWDNVKINLMSKQIKNLPWFLVFYIIECKKNFKYAVDALYFILIHSLLWKRFKLEFFPLCSRILNYRNELIICASKNSSFIFMFFKSEIFKHRITRNLLCICD